MFFSAHAPALAVILAASLSVACSDDVSLGGKSTKSGKSQSLTGDQPNARNAEDTGGAGAGGNGVDNGAGAGAGNNVDSELAGRTGADGGDGTDDDTALSCEAANQSQLDAAKGKQGGWGGSGSGSGAVGAANAICKNFDRSAGQTYVVCQIDGTALLNCTPYQPGDLAPALTAETRTEFADRLQQTNAANHGQCLQLVAEINKTAAQDPVGCFRVQDQPDGTDKNALMGR
jgi:hypothetical protein